jgi:hypothetical protein
MSFGDKEMIDIVRDVEKYMKEVSAGIATCKNCLLKVKPKNRDRDEFDKDLFAFQFTREDENIAKIERFAKHIFFNISNNIYHFLISKTHIFLLFHILHLYQYQL